MYGSPGRENQAANSSQGRQARGPSRSPAFRRERSRCRRPSPLPMPERFPGPGPFVSPNGEYLFFNRRVSWVTTIPTDIYWVDSSVLWTSLRSSRGLGVPRSVSAARSERSESIRSIYTCFLFDTGIELRHSEGLRSRGSRGRQPRRWFSAGRCAHGRVPSDRRDVERYVLL